MSIGDKPAFPRLGFRAVSKEGYTSDWVPEQPGMTLRQYYIGQALQGVLASNRFNTADVAANFAVDAADQAIAQLGRSESKEQRGRD